MHRILLRALTTVLVLTLPAFAQEVGIPNQTMPEQGVVFGGQPTAEQIAEMAAGGTRTVIDLRGAEEDQGMDEGAVATAAGLGYVKIPVTRDTLSDPATFQSFFDAFAAAEKPVVVHCASGNRVGALYYAWLVSEQGVAREEALATARDNGLRSDALVTAVDAYLDSR